MYGRSTLGGSGLSAYYGSLGMVPAAAGNFAQAIPNAQSIISENRQRWNEQEQARRDKKTAERKQRQSLGLNLGIAAGGSLAGAGIGAALTKPVGEIAAVGTNAAAPAAASSFVGPQQPDLSAPAPSVPYSSVENQFAAEFPGGGDPSNSLGLSAERQARGYAPQPVSNGLVGQAQPQPKYGYLGNSRGAVFGNLFVRGLASQIPGVGGVVQGLDAANQYNYQVSRDLVSDAYNAERLGLAREGNQISRDTLGATIANRNEVNKLNWAKADADVGLRSGELNRKISEDAARQNRFDVSQTGLSDYRDRSLDLRKRGLDQSLQSNENTFNLGVDRNRIMDERNQIMRDRPGGMTPDERALAYGSRGYDPVFEDDPIVKAAFDEKRRNVLGLGSNSNDVSSSRLNILDTQLKEGKITQEMYDKYKKKYGL